MQFDAFMHTCIEFSALVIMNGLIVSIVSGFIGLFYIAINRTIFRSYCCNHRINVEQIIFKVKKFDVCKDSFQPIHTPNEGEEYMLKPMNCPHHCEIYKFKPRSYKDLPIRLAEFGTVYRYEQSGELHGLTRVRGFTQDDAHLFCRQDQIKEEFCKVQHHRYAE